MADEPLFLTNLWYMAGLSASLAAGAMRREMLCGEPVLLGRTKEGGLFALRDICPHRAAPLSAGRIREGTVESRARHGGSRVPFPSALETGCALDSAGAERLGDTYRQARFAPSAESVKRPV